MIYQTINFADFREAFRRFGRQNQFSEQCLHILFDYLEQLSQEVGEDWELDVIGLCCDFVEMSESEVRENYTLDHDDDVEEYLQDNTMLCGMYENESGETVFVFQQF